MTIKVGMAVPVDGVRIIFEAILKCFAMESYESIKASINPLIMPQHIDIYNQDSNEDQLIILEEKEEYMAS